MKYIYSMLLALCCVVFACAQPADSSSKHRNLEEVTVTGSQRVTHVDNVIDIRQIPMPALVIDRKAIEAMGSRRLDELLREQTGMAVVSNLGAGNRSVGLQMQGFSAEYITILLDGQPMAGRSSGNFDLSRVTLSQVERIEIVKGASSSLFGSEALGGVVNIITRQQVSQTQALANVLYGSFHSLDATVEAETSFSDRKGTAFVSANYYKTDGFNTDPLYLKDGKTVPPYNSLTLQGRGRYQLGARHTLHTSIRYSGRHSEMVHNYGRGSVSKDVLDENDFNGMLALNSQLNGNTRVVSRYYFTHYGSRQDVTDVVSGDVLQRNNFLEQVHRGEVQFAHDVTTHDLKFIGGAGGEYLRTSNFDDKAAGGSMANYFVYVQGNWKPYTGFNVIAGARYSGNNRYGGKLTPSIGVNYSPASWITIKASAGQGFKSPTYRQMYQVFTNFVYGYTIVGSNIIQQGIRDLEKAGVVQEIWPAAATVSNLKAETSTSYNGGFTITPVSHLELGVSGFYNSIHNMIYSRQIGIKTNSGRIESYFNIDRAYTSGLEASVRYTPLAGLLVSAGYQFLYAKDRGVIDSIEAGVSPYNQLRAVGGVVRATSKDYFGLPDRSRHMVNLQVFYEYKPWGVNLSLRSSYRSRYGFMDQDDNRYIDPYDVFVRGYALFHFSAQKKLAGERLTVQFSVENIGDYTDRLMPAQPGRMFMAGLAWRCFAQKNKPGLQ
ncbi:TonB-dependent receptor plug domain-containing protein [Filimonas effusa]|uniref:TonB-dependent receptor n=1 Tax=Filimonas effusa TaxID=2508721 RepID=A0A4Q1D4T1_9BACT|nr:TonB-dependent receptor [Filimonas effusa]RXK82956.1 TonB-dependent receptor [Filimonas effusa]